MKHKDSLWDKTNYVNRERERELCTEGAGKASVAGRDRQGMSLGLENQVYSKECGAD